MSLASERPTRTVRVAQGALVGEDGPVAVFRGVPYAVAARWTPPEPAPPWTGVRDATLWGPDCPQPPGVVGIRASRQDEDCLNLNIWTPVEASDTPLPVMVWFFGGGFLFGSPSSAVTDGARLAAEGCVVVAVNHRVGLFGFLAHPELTRESPHGASGNYGLMDCIEGLRWVRENIAAFGGDPSRVTIFGLSSGGAIVSLMLTSPLAQGLFHRAILQSPGSFRLLSPLAEAEAMGLQLGPDIKALRALPAAELLERTHLVAPRMRALTAPRVLRPIHDGWVVPVDEMDAYRTGAFTPAPILVGSNADEGGLHVADWPISTRTDWEELLDRSFGEDFSAQAREAYPVASDAEVKPRLAEVYGDTQFTFGAWGVAQAMAPRAPTYRYLFLRRRPGQADGPFHGKEPPYIFGNLDGAANLPFDEADERLSKTIRRYWTTFAATGDPNASDQPAWPRYDPAQDRYLRLDDEVSVGSGWRAPQMDLLERYYAR